jgi:hypothetical protein
MVKLMGFACALRHRIRQKPPMVVPRGLPCQATRRSILFFEQNILWA